MTHEKLFNDHRVSTDMDGEPLGRRVSALEGVPTFVPPAGYPGIPVTRRVSTVSQSSRVSFQNDYPEDLEDLVCNTSAISKQRSWNSGESQDSIFELPSFPRSAKPGPSTQPPSSAFGLISGPPSPGAASGPQSPAEYETGAGQDYPDIDTLASIRGAVVLLCTCGAQLIDNVFMTGVNIALPSIQRDFDVKNGELQWLISAYTLTFGGFLLLAGVLADRFGRKLVFCCGMATLSIWTVASGFATSFIQLAIFRALQGIGAAMTVPSAVGIISNYFVAGDRTLALTIFGAAGAVGLCLGLIFGGFLTSSLGRRYIFYIPAAVSGALGVIGWILLPKDRLEGNSKPRLDFVGAGLSTAGLILFSFVLSSGGEYGWGKAFIIILLVLSIALIVAFTYVEKKVPNPIMPLSLWKLQNFAALWIGGFVMYGGYQTTVYYTTLIAQEVNKLSACETALRFLPMGATGFIFSISMSRMLEIFNTKYLLILGMTICPIAPIPSALMKQDDLNFWKHVFPTTFMGVAGTTIVYCTITVVLLASVPLNVKSLCGGMINTAFQIGSGVGLALASAIVQAVDTGKGHSQLQQCNTGLWCCVGFASVGVVASMFGVKKVGKAVGSPVVTH